MFENLLIEARDRWLIGLLAALPLTTGCLSLRPGMGVPAACPVSCPAVRPACMPLAQYHETRWHRLIELGDCHPAMEDGPLPPIEEYQDIEALPQEAIPEDVPAEIQLDQPVPADPAAEFHEQGETNAALPELRPLRFPAERHRPRRPAESDDQPPVSSRSEMAPLPPPPKATGSVVPASAYVDITPLLEPDSPRPLPDRTGDPSLVHTRVMPAE